MLLNVVIAVGVIFVGIGLVGVIQNVVNPVD